MNLVESDTNTLALVPGDATREFFRRNDESEIPGKADRTLYLDGRSRVGDVTDDTAKRAAVTQRYCSRL